MRNSKKTVSCGRIGLFVLLALACAIVAEAQNCIPPPPDLVSWWPFDGNENDIQDGNSGTLIGAGTFPAAKVDQGFKSAPGSFVRVNDNGPSNLDVTNFTIDAWVRVDALPLGENRVVVWKGDALGSSASTPYGLSISGTTNLSPDVDIVPGSVFAVIGNGAIPNGRQFVSTRQTGYTIPIGVFTHIAVTADGATFKLYIDGTVRATAPQTITPYTNDKPLQIGGFQSFPANDGYFLDGVIDELEIHSSALGVGDIKAIFDAGSRGKCKNAVIIPTLSEWGAIIFAALLLASIAFYNWRRDRIAAS